jgi:hypothetical protein
MTLALVPSNLLMEIQHPFLHAAALTQSARSLTVWDGAAGAGAGGAARGGDGRLAAGAEFGALDSVNCVNLAAPLTPPASPPRCS